MHTEAHDRDRLLDYGPQRLTVELINTCNLHCAYCLRDDDALHHDRAVYLPVDLFAKIVADAREAMGVTHVMFTGGEPTLHRDFGAVLSAVRDASITCSFVTNGWHFERVWPAISAHPGVVTHVAFSLDGTTLDDHDRWRGKGSFALVVRAMTRCWASGLPFTVKVGIRRDTISELERFALFAARLGAGAISFAHFMPTSAAASAALALTMEERATADREIAQLASILKMRVGIDVGYYNISTEAPCGPLAGVSGNVDYRGRLSLCCNLSGYRGGSGASDLVADLTRESFAAGAARLRARASAQAARRVAALATCAARGAKPDLTTGSPCLFCLHTLDKTPWSEAVEERIAR
jgi:MoaA/NifB/PqqE/SkfB family radical SAM enzyme